MKIGEKIKKQRTLNKWTQEQLAGLLNVSRSTVSSWEVGRNYPDLEMIIILSDLLGISLDTLLREDSEMIKDTTKNLKRGKIYRNALVMIGILVAFFLGVQGKMMLDEENLRSNLVSSGWQPLVDSDDKPSAYGLDEEGITYKAILSPVRWGTNSNIIIFSKKEEFFIEVSGKDEIAVSLSSKNDYTFDKHYSVFVDKNGKLANQNAGLSSEETKRISTYLELRNDTYADLIEKTLDQKAQLDI